MIDYEILPTARLSAAEQQSIWIWLRQAFQVLTDEYQWADADYHLRAWDGAQLVGHVDITLRDVQAGGQPLRLGGIGGVVTLPDWRRQGIASEALRLAQAFLCDPLDVDAGLLICDPLLLPFYARLGWQAVPGPLFFDQPDGRRRFDGQVMVLPLRIPAWPAGTIDLQGLPW
ncbi:MAG: GNAT family N-acetyltransferase [Chloroflexota bacterium]